MGPVSLERFHPLDPPVSQPSDTGTRCRYSKTLNESDPIELTPWPLPRVLWQPVAERLVSTDPREARQAGRQLVEHASLHGIDFGLAVATLQRDTIRQVCLPVLGGGRTVMLFVSRPGQGASLGVPGVQHAERTGVVRTVLERLIDEPRAALAQGLSLPGERFAIEAFDAAGMTRIAELQYLSRPLARRVGRLPRPDETIDPPRGDAWPGGVEVRAYPATMPDARGDGDLARALTLSYEGTLDCPALQSMRVIGDVIGSHRDTGDWTPGLWWIVRRVGTGEPLGCLLLNPSSADDSVELTYLGLGASVRGCGLAGALLSRGIEFGERLGMSTIRCAVDTRNLPARRLYERAGFVPVASRVAHACRIARSEGC